MSDSRRLARAVAALAVAAGFVACDGPSSTVPIIDQLAFKKGNGIDVTLPAGLVNACGKNGRCNGAEKWLERENNRLSAACQGLSTIDEVYPLAEAQLEIEAQAQALIPYDLGLSKTCIDKAIDLLDRRADQIESDCESSTNLKGRWYLFRESEQISIVLQGLGYGQGFDINSFCDGLFDPERTYVLVEPSDLILFLEETETLNATIECGLKECVGDLIWDSENPEIASVIKIDESGKSSQVTALIEGTTKIWAMSEIADSLASVNPPQTLAGYAAVDVESRNCAPDLAYLDVEIGPVPEEQRSADGDGVYLFIGESTQMTVNAVMIWSEELQQTVPTDCLGSNVRFKPYYDDVGEYLSVSPDGLITGLKPMYYGIGVVAYLEEYPSVKGMKYARTIWTFCDKDGHGRIDRDMAEWGTACCVLENIGETLWSNRSADTTLYFPNGCPTPCGGHWVLENSYCMTVCKTGEVRQAEIIGLGYPTCYSWGDSRWGGTTYPWGGTADANGSSAVGFGWTAVSLWSRPKSSCAAVSPVFVARRSLE